MVNPIDYIDGYYVCNCYYVVHFYGALYESKYLKLMKENFKFHKIKMTIEIFEKWIKVLIKPKEVFAEEKANASLGRAIGIVFVAVIIAGIFLVIKTYTTFTFLGSTSLGTLIHNVLSYGFSETLSLPEFLILLFVSNVIQNLIGFLIVSGIFYIFAKLLKGTGNFTTHIYLIALLSAPCIVIAGAISIIPFIGYSVAFLTYIYEVYLLTLALKETHQYSTGRAIFTWLIPAIVLAVIMVVIVTWITSIYL